jgi:hypothetical protein
VGRGVGEQEKGSPLKKVKKLTVYTFFPPAFCLLPSAFLHWLDFDELRVDKSHERLI